MSAQPERRDGSHGNEPTAPEPAVPQPQAPMPTTATAAGPRPVAARPTPPQSHQPLEPWLTTAQVCRLLGVNDRSILRYRRTRNFPEPIKLGHRTVRYEQRKVEHWVRAAARNTGAELEIDWESWADPAVDPLGDE